MQTVNTQISTVSGSLDLKEGINRRQLLPLSRLPWAEFPLLLWRVSIPYSSGLSTTICS
jgi:hypothetical protein